MRQGRLLILLLIFASGCAVSPGNGTAHLLSINYSLLRRPSLVYEQFEHRPPHRSRVEYFRWLHGGVINPTEVTALMSSPASQNWEMTTDPSANPQSSGETLMAPGGHAMPLPAVMAPESGTEFNMTTPAPGPTSPEQPDVPMTPAPIISPDDGRWLEMFPDSMKDSIEGPQSGSTPATSGSPSPEELTPLFPDKMPPLSPKSPDEGLNQVTAMSHERWSLPASHSSGTLEVPQSRTHKVSSRLLFSTR